MVSQKPEASRPASQRTQAPASASASNTAPTTGLTRSQAAEPVAPAPSASQASGPDYVEMERGYLVHRVSYLFFAMYLDDLIALGWLHG